MRVCYVLSVRFFFFEFFFGSKYLSVAIYIDPFDAAENRRDIVQVGAECFSHPQ